MYGARYAPPRSRSFGHVETLDGLTPSTASSSFRFELIHKSKQSRARVGRIHTPHGVVDTPGFVPVGTNATIKHLDSSMLPRLGVQLMFANTYHLAVHPGPEVIAGAGGLHKFMGYEGSLITDSGGFQVFSLMYGSVAEELKSSGVKTADGGVKKISEEGVVFRNYRDGSKMLLTPESSVQLQKSFGADIIIPFDELPPFHISSEALQASFDRTHRWQTRSLRQHLTDVRQQAMYSVIHGGTSAELRRNSADYLSQLPFDGHAIGGSLGKTREDVVQVVRMVTPHLAEAQPRHLLGIGHEESFEDCVKEGIDTFDSCYPSRIARHGTLLTLSGKRLYLRSTQHRDRHSPIDPDCPCFTCRRFSLAYLHHLHKANEHTAAALATQHNLTTVARMMAQLRERILRDEI
jgi:queuine tRNA-ribosyltransferase